MPAPPELLFLRSVKTGKGLQKLIKNLQKQRRAEKETKRKRAALTSKQRSAILEKTGGRCHLCGIELGKSSFHADHVHQHSKGGEHAEHNYLPCCATCNNLRWHYSPEEIQLILRLGRWLKTELVNGKEESLELANRFVKKVMSLRKSGKA